MRNYLLICLILAATPVTRAVAATIFETDTKRDIEYAPDHPRQKLDLYRPGKPADSKATPAPKAESPLPVIVFLHGGGWNMGSKEQISWFAAGSVASGEYAAVAANYRLSQHAKWPAQIHDCMAVIRWIRANAKEYDLDPDRIAVIGMSAGGHLAAMLGTAQQSSELVGEVGPNTKISSKVSCVVALAAPADFNALDPDGILARSRPNNPVIQLLGSASSDLAEKASPLSHVSKGDAPFLIVHGSADNVVPVAQGKLLHDALKKADVESRLIEVKGAGHMGILTPEIHREIQAFIKRHLQKAQTE